MKMYTALIINQGRLYPVFSNSNESLEEFQKRLKDIPILEIQEWEELTSTQLVRIIVTHGKAMLTLLLESKQNKSSYNRISTRRVNNYVH